jgi:hypothetical protein
MRLKSGSVWTGMLLHPSHNLFVQQVLTPFTADTGHTRYFIDEFGAFLPLTTAITAMIFWKLPRPPSSEPSTQPQESTEPTLRRTDRVESTRAYRNGLAAAAR